MWQRARLNSKPLVELTQSLIQERVILRADALIDTEAHTQGEESSSARPERTGAYRSWNVWDLELYQ